MVRETAIEQGNIFASKGDFFASPLKTRGNEGDFLKLAAFGPQKSTVRASRQNDGKKLPVPLDGKTQLLCKSQEVLVAGVKATEVVAADHQALTAAQKVLGMGEVLLAYGRKRFL